MDDWKTDLNGLLGGRAHASRAEQETAQFTDFMQRVVRPAFAQLREELQRHDREVVIREAPASITMTVRRGDTDEISFRVLMRSLPKAMIPYAEVRVRKGLRLVRSEGLFREIQNTRGLEDVGGDDIIRCFLKYYRAAVDAESPAGPT